MNILPMPEHYEESVRALEVAAVLQQRIGSCHARLRELPYKSDEANSVATEIGRLANQIRAKVKWAEVQAALAQVQNLHRIAKNLEELVGVIDR